MKTECTWVFSRYTWWMKRHDYYSMKFQMATELILRSYSDILSLSEVRWRDSGLSCGITCDGGTGLRVPDEWYRPPKEYSLYCFSQGCRASCPRIQHEPLTYTSCSSTELIANRISYVLIVITRHLLPELIKIVVHISWRPLGVSQDLADCSWFTMVSSSREGKKHIATVLNRIKYDEIPPCCQECILKSSWYGITTKSDGSLKILLDF